MEAINSENLRGTFLKYTLLNTVSMLGLSFYILADTLIIAIAAGNMGLTALNLALPVFSFMMAIGQMIAMGSSSLFSAFKGNDDNENANRIFTVALYIDCALSLVILLTGLLASKQVCMLMGANSETLSLTNEYLKILMIFGPAFIFNNLFTYFVRNDGNPKLAMAAMLVSSISNVILDMVFVFLFDMGIMGAAVATGISPILSMIILSLHFLTRRNSFRPVWCRPHLRELIRIPAIGSPVFVTEFGFGIVMLAVNYSILGITGNVGVAAYSVISNVALVAKSFFGGISQGVQPLTSFFTGRNDSKSVAALCRMGIVMSLAVGVILFVLCVALQTPLIALFNTDNDIEMARIAAEGVPLYFPAFIFMGVNQLAEVFFASVQKPAKSFMISVMRGMALVLLFIAVLPPILQMAGVWLAVPLSECVVFVFSVISMVIFIKRSNAGN